MTPKPVPKSGPSKQEILKALKTVIDPELHINIVDLGLIYGVKTNPTIITFTLTSPGCILAETIHKLIGSAVKGAKLNLVWDPPWTTDKISTKYKAEFGL